MSMAVSMVVLMRTSDGGTDECSYLPLSWDSPTLRPPSVLSNEHRQIDAARGVAGAKRISEGRCHALRRWQLRSEGLRLQAFSRMDLTGQLSNLSLPGFS